MRTTVIVIFYLAIATSAVGMIFGLFALGDTETFSVPFTLMLMMISVSGAIVAGTLQWVGLPTKNEPEDPAKDRKH